MACSVVSILWMTFIMEKGISLFTHSEGMVPKAALRWQKLSPKCGTSCKCNVASSVSLLCKRIRCAQTERGCGPRGQWDSWMVMTWVVVKPEARAYSTHSVRQTFDSVVSPFYIFTIINLMILPKTKWQGLNLASVQTPPVTFANGWLFFFYVSARKSSIFT